MKNLETYSQVCDHAWFVEHHESIGSTQPFVTVLRGSQNYLLDTPESDVDTETLLVPTFYEIITNRNRLSKTLIYPDNSHCGVRDIRDMVENWKKQNPAFLELLFSDYVRAHTLDTRFWELWEELRAKREDIAHYNTFKFVFTTVGQVENKYKTFKTDTEAHHPALEKYGYVPKELVHMVRLNYVLKLYITGSSFEECLVLPEDTRAYLISIKNGELSYEAAKQLRENVIEQAHWLRANYAATHFEERNHETEKFLNDWLIKVFKVVNERELK